MSDSTTPSGRDDDQPRPSDDARDTTPDSVDDTASQAGGDAAGAEGVSSTPSPTPESGDQAAGGTVPSARADDAADFTDVPTGEVITGPIDPGRIAPPTAYSQAGNPPTREMEPIGTGEFDPSSNPELPTADPASAHQVSHSSPAADKGRRRRTVALVSAAVVLLLVIAGVGTELYMRNKVTSCIENAFGNLTGAATEVSVSRKPMLLSAFGSDVPWVQVDTNDGDTGKMRLHARAEGISTDGGTVRSLDGSGYLPYDRITELSNGESGGGPTIKEITADEGAGTIKLSTEVPIAILSIPATVTLKPVLTEGALKFEVKDATALMFGLPSDFAQPIVDQVTSSMFGPLFKQIHVQEFKVVNGGIDFRFAGQDVNLKAASEGSSESGSGGNCSI